LERKFLANNRGFFGGLSLLGECLGGLLDGGALHLSEGWERDDLNFCVFNQQPHFVKLQLQRFFQINRLLPCDVSVRLPLLAKKRNLLRLNQ